MCISSTSHTFRNPGVIVLILYLDIPEAKREYTKSQSQEMEEVGYKSQVLQKINKKRFDIQDISQTNILTTKVFINLQCEREK